MSDFLESSNGVKDDEIVVLVPKASESEDEQKSFSVLYGVAKVSNLVSELVQYDESGRLQSVPLPNVSSKSLGQVVRFMTEHNKVNMNTIQTPLTDVDMAKLVNEPFATMITSFSQEELFEIVLAAHYMDVQPLTNLCCARIATMIKGKTPDEIRKTFNIVGDFTPEEENQVREDNNWCED